MKSFILIVTISLTNCFLTFGQNGMGNPPIKKDGSELLEKYPGNRPNSLESESVYCYYDSGVLVFELPDSIEGGTVNIYNSTQGWMGYVTREFPEVEIPFTSGSYTIEFFTNDGREFSGIIDL